MGVAESEAKKEETRIAPSSAVLKPLHILLIHQSFAALDEAGGTRHHELARFLADQGHRVTVITSPISYLSGKNSSSGHRGWASRENDGPRITILRTYTYAAFHRSFIHRAFSFISFMISSFWAGLRVPSVDIVWGTSPPIFQGITAWLLARLKGVPFLFEVRDLWPEFAISVGVLRNPVLIRASRALERFLYRHADRVMVNSPGYVQHVQDRGAHQVDLIPNGADPDMFQPFSNGECFRAQHHLENKFIALYAGAHGLSNDLGVVLQAAQRLQGQAEICFVFLGDGKEKSQLQELAASMALKNVQFIAAVPKNEMSGALAAADACIAILKPIPLYATTYPNKVFDYMAAGRPVILAIGGEIRKVVESVSAGIIVPPGDPVALADAVKQLAAMPDRGRSMGMAGRQLVEQQFSRADMAKKLAFLLDKLSSGRNSSDSALGENNIEAAPSQTSGDSAPRNNTVDSAPGNNTGDSGRQDG